MTNDDALREAQLAYAQARAYGKDLARLYAAEKERRKELETTTKKLQAIFDMAPNGLAVVDNQLTLLEANPRFLKLFQQSPEVVGKPLADFLPVAEIQAAIDRVKNDPHPLAAVEVEISEPIQRTLLFNISLLGEDQGWVLIVHDMTERKRLEGLKDEFVNIAAHELRTPLAGVMGFVGVLQEDLSRLNDPMINNVLNMVMQSTDRLRKTIDELVEFATTARTGQKQLSIADIDLYRLVQKSVRQLQDKMAAQNISCTVEFPPDGLTVRGDAYILDGVIYQLLNNAVKFNKPGGKIYVRARQLSPTEALDANIPPGSVVLEVEDTGIGIPEAEIDKIFDKFYQVEEHLTRATGGLGLGLTIARSGVEQHGGRLTVSSRLGHGSTFRMYLPPLNRLNEISIDKRLDMVHKQMLSYAQDMAHAVAAERKMRRRLEQIFQRTQELAGLLKPVLTGQSSGQPLPESGRDKIRALLKQILDLSSAAQENGQKPPATG
ncbi:MAG: PAS domain-containing protein [Chloroflexi bacterium]|nr:MAG: PAS domain-containing protein [Chloroflexota bacterium]